MKTRKHNLNAIALGVALAMGSISAANADFPKHPGGALAEGIGDISRAEMNGQNPTFSTPIRTGLALVESSLSLIAARATEVDSKCTVTTYGLEVHVANTLPGWARIGDLHNNVNAATAILDGSTAVNNRGAFVTVTARPGSNLKGTLITHYAGSHLWNAPSAIFIDNATFRLANIPFAERSIKDYYNESFGRRDRNEKDDHDHYGEVWAFDWGLESILKQALPVKKWTELSWFRQTEKDHGRDGRMQVIKDTLAPDTYKAQCEIVYTAKGYSDGWDFNYKGIVQVGPPTHYHH